MKGLICCTVHKILLEASSEGGWDERSM